MAIWTQRALIVAAATGLPSGAGAQIDTPAEGCRTGVLRGDGSLVEQLRTALAASGCIESVETGATIDIESAPGNRVHLAVRGPGGANAERDVDRIATAALIVESWAEATRVDLLEPTSADPGVADPAEGPTLGPSQPTRAATAASLSAHGTAAFGNDGSTWFGAEIAGCARLGPTCFGGAVRYLADVGLSEGTASENGTRTMLGGDVELSLPLEPTPEVSVTPALALGLAWLDSIVYSAGRTLGVDGLRALVLGSCSVAVALVESLWLDIRVSVLWSPLARQAPWMFEGASVDSDPVVLGAASLGLRMDIR
jgi:hypothetical protein